MPRYNLSIPCNFGKSSESQYWLGFLLADGCVYEPGAGKGSTVLKVTCKDKEHLEKLQGFLSSKHKLRQTKDACWQLHIRSNELCDMLVGYGIHPRKSCVEKVDRRLKDSRHFWRGVVDGDGWICWDKHNKSPVIGLCGSREVCYAFRDHLLSIAHFQSRAKPRQRGNIYQYELRCRLAKAAIKELYDNCNVSLDRKLSLAQRYTDE